MIPSFLKDAKNGFYTGYSSELKTVKMQTVVKKVRYCSISIRENNTIIIFFNDGDVVSIIDGIIDKPELNYKIWKIDEIYLAL